ncbi:hypothetical protein [Paraburkholderia unamae]|uniref:Cyd operon protein YbgE n=1 Tax=Paraburkholderia unamae TaxID=219649 RepID=A0ABX5KU03_9BURK|nr:hypothetical protein [Paraburkholderia unamae]PVX85505.1 hypothetical protein C7402_10373 [Paraburkholderia unamae]RAR55284.1 hypothetical protein C7401_12268 [Paraburkholderia unamae]CAG9267934.1 membrane hypothetical protein [Paraburkholderia unamae]
MNAPTSNQQPSKVCDAAVGIAIIALGIYCLAVWHQWLPALRGAGTVITAYCGVVAVWRFYDTVIRIQQGWSSALCPLALVVGGLGAFIMAYQH